MIDSKEQLIFQVRHFSGAFAFPASQMRVHPVSMRFKDDFSVLFIFKKE